MALVLRLTKGSPLEWAEVDANFSGLADGSLLNATALAAKTFTTLALSGALTVAGITTSAPILAANGSAAAPSYSFSTHPTSGIYNSGSGEVDVSALGVRTFSVQSGNVYCLGVGVALNLLSDAATLKWGSTSDLILARDAANTLAQRNGVNAQSFRLYNTFTDAANYERGVYAWSGNALQLGTQAAGTGIIRQLHFITGGVSHWGIGTDGLFFAATDSTYDIGASGANRPRNVFIGRDLTVGDQLIVAGAGPHAIGGVTSTDVQLLIQGTFSPSVSTGAALQINTTLNAVANQSAAALILAPTIVEAASGTHPDFSSAEFRAPTITAGAAALTSASTVKITGAPTGATNNYALWVASGQAKFDGSVVAPTIGPTAAQQHTLPAVTSDTVVLLAAAQTLTNKTLALGSNTVSGTLAQFNTAVTDADFASLAGIETLTNKTLTTFGGAFTFNPLNLSATLSPTGTGTVTINPATLGNIDNTRIGFTTRAAAQFTTLDANGNVNLSGGTFVFNESGADLDFRAEGDTEANLFFLDASTDRIGFKTNAPQTDVELRATVNRALDIQITNLSTGTGVYSEFRVGNASGAGDFGITGTGFTADATLAANEVFVVAESTSAGLHFKHNGDTYIRFSKGISAVVQEVARFANTGALLLGHTVSASTAKGSFVVPNNVAIAALNAAGNAPIGIAFVGTNNRVNLNCNSTVINFADSLTQAGTGAVATYWRVRIGGVDRVIPVHAES